MERFEKGHAWIMEGAVDPITFGHNVLGGTPGGLTPEGRREWVFWEEVPKGTYDPVAHLEAMDEDGVGAAVMYPTPRVSAGIQFTNKEPEFHLALVRAYNDWLSEWSSTDPGRLGGIAMMPTLGIEECLHEMRRVAKMPGLRAASSSADGRRAASRSPMKTSRSSPRPPRPASPSTSTSPSAPRPPGPRRRAPPATCATSTPPSAPSRSSTAASSTATPDLKLVWAETDCGWVPYVKEQMDDRFHRLEAESRPAIREPSQLLLR